MQLPTQNPITLSFGATSAPYTPSSPHTGTDYSSSPNSTVYAVEDCFVVYRTNNGRDGNALYATVGNRSWGYLHLERMLKSGDVKKGEAIGVMGASGAAQGKHLHLALKVDGKFVDPDAFIKQGERMTKSEAYTVVTGFYKWGTGAPPSPELGEYWADRLANTSTGLDELYQAMDAEAAKNAEYELVTETLYREKK